MGTRTHKILVINMTTQEKYDNLRTRWLNTTDDIEALECLQEIGDYKTEHPDVMDKKVAFN
ncbi:hypothetical protein WKT22_00779 [Candidatus Lokiarchaeum ossiferum]